MSDVMKKRLTGLAILIIIAVLIPLLLSRCMHGKNSKQNVGSMRVYDIQPNGKTVRAKQQQGSDNAQNQPKEQTADETRLASSSNSDTASSDNSSNFSTPPVHGNSGDQSAAHEQAAVHVNAGEPTNKHSTSASRHSEERSHPHSKTETEKKTGSSSGHSTSSSTQKAPADGTKESNLSGWVVQVASFTKRSNASSLAKQLGDKFQASYSQVDVKGKTYYHVYVGPFDDKDKAHSAADRLEKADHGALVRHL